MTDTPTNLPIKSAITGTISEFKKDETDKSNIQVANVSTDQLKEQIDKYDYTGLIQRLHEERMRLSRHMVDFHNPHRVGLKDIPDEDKTELFGDLFDGIPTTKTIPIFTCSTVFMEVAQNEDDIQATGLFQTSSDPTIGYFFNGKNRPNIGGFITDVGGITAYAYNHQHCTKSTSDYLTEFHLSDNSSSNAKVSITPSGEKNIYPYSTDNDYLYKVSFDTSVVDTLFSINMSNYNKFLTKECNSIQFTLYSSNVKSDTLSIMFTYNRKKQKGISLVLNLDPTLQIDQAIVYAQGENGIRDDSKLLMVGHVIKLETNVYQFFISIDPDYLPLDNSEPVTSLNVSIYSTNQSIENDSQNNTQIFYSGGSSEYVFYNFIVSNGTCLGGIPSSISDKKDHLSILTKSIIEPIVENSRGTEVITTVISGASFPTLENSLDTRPFSKVSTQNNTIDLYPKSWIVYDTNKKEYQIKRRLQLHYKDQWFILPNNITSTDVWLSYLWYIKDHKLYYRIDKERNTTIVDLSTIDGFPSEGEYVILPDTSFDVAMNGLGFMLHSYEVYDHIPENEYVTRFLLSRFQTTYFK